MPVKSLFDSARESSRKFYASVLRGEVSDANVRGYLRMTSQIEDIWTQVEQKVATLIAQGANPWDAYAQAGYPLAFVRAARTCTVFVRELLAADAAADPSTAGFLPHVSYDQAHALSAQIQPSLEHAVMALNDPNYVPDVRLPLQLGPRIESEGAPCPVAHLQGMIAAATETREWAAGLLAQYENALSDAKAPVPAAITTHVDALKRRLALADFQLRAGTDLVGQISQGEATAELHEKAEDSLWEAMQGFFLISQSVARPELLTAKQTRSGFIRKRGAYHDRRITPDDLWEIADKSARQELRGTQFGTDEMEEMCQKMRGVLSARAQQYADEVEQAVYDDNAYVISKMANCPFEPLYRSRTELTLAGQRIPADYEFHWDYHRGKLDYRKRFGRIQGWQECQEEGSDD
ncbi:MAG: hypothetical protein ACJ8CB_18165 [Ktedonobacteraceae bacterium]